MSSERIDDIINELEEVPTSLEEADAWICDLGQIHVAEEDLELTADEVRELEDE